MTIFGYGMANAADETAENQRLEIERAGFPVHFWLADTVTDLSRAAHLPQLRELLGQIRGKDTLVVTKLDQLGRDSLEVLTNIKLLIERKVRVIILQLGNESISSTAGRLLLARKWATISWPNTRRAAF